ncbi:MAG: carboxypeptidase M32 [Anaerolineales bacterium]|nr:carboxypeptidase M32 [Anaerolineales bacterium]
MEEQYKRLLELLGEVSDLQAAAAVLGWDQQTYMPPGGAQGRSMHLATITRLAHEKFVNEEIGELLEALKSEAADLDPDSDEACIVKQVSREYEKQRKVPGEWVADFSRVTSMAHQSWEKARKESDFPTFEPDLESVFELRRQYVDFFTPYDHIYDPLLDDFEPGLKTSDVIQIFEELRPKQVELVQAIAESSNSIDDAVLYQSFDETKQWDFGEEVIKAFGYDFDRGRQDKSPHPFTTSFSIDDVRITTRVRPDFLSTALFGTLHEAGHAMYEQGISDSLARTPLEGGTSLAVHESQSRMWENLVGRSKPFWVAFYSRLQEYFPSELGDVKLDDFYQAINLVEPSLIRVEADEATYNLHIMLRFELELALLEQQLKVSDLPEVWNQKMDEYLGVTPPNDAEGVLQDIHWSMGIFGYFSTYSLGNLIATMLWDKMKIDIPDLEKQIELGKFDDLLGWHREKIHQHGGKYEPMDLVKRATGSELSAEPYIRYLQTKFGEIYDL